VAGEDSDIIIGWDLGLGGGERAKELPCEPDDIVLIEAKDSFTPGEGFRYAHVQVWGLDPRLAVVCAFSRSPNPSLNTTFNTGNITATITASTRTRSRGNILTGPPLPAVDLFLNGGNIDAAGNDDGCELGTGMQGVQFDLVAQRTDATSVDIVLSIQAKPRVALGCSELARKLIRNMTVSRIGAPGKF
jgi:hypothetical protein